MTSFRRLSVFAAFLVIALTTMSFSLNGNLNATAFRLQNLNIEVDGTSTLHDWTIKSTKGQAEVNLELASDKLTGITGLNFSIPAESLKSGNNMMDNNTYKALKTDKNKNISYVLTAGSISQVNGTTFQIKTNGKLTIAGTSKETDLVATARYNAADKSNTISGEKKIKMSQWGVKPPTVMMGTIKTGDDITIKYTAKIVK
ncbi:MAG: YceI family protein [Chitinophagaceae bacterium]